MTGIDWEARASAYLNEHLDTDLRDWREVYEVGSWAYKAGVRAGLEAAAKAHRQRGSAICAVGYKEIRALMPGERD